LLIPLGGWLVFHSPFMAVRRVVVVGEVHATPEQIVEASGLSRHPLMVDVDAGAIKRRVESLPWVASVSVVKRWPETVKLVVHERSAVAEVPGPGATSALVDPTGRVLAVEPGSIGGLVQLSGVHLAPVGRQIKPVWKARELLDLVQALQSSWIPNLEVAKVSPSGQLSAQVQSPANPDIEVLIGSDGQLRAKLIALDTLLNRVPMAGVVSIDVRVPGSPVLTRQS
jgi:cell division protein FtsQ